MILQTSCRFVRSVIRRLQLVKEADGQEKTAVHTNSGKHYDFKNSDGEIAGTVEFSKSLTFRVTI